MAKARKVRYLAVRRSGGTEPAASMPPWELESVQGWGAGRLLRGPQLGKPMADQPDPHVDHKRLAANFPYFPLYTR